jgi:RNA polymerase sigma factor (sigma-70 family)
MEVSRELIQRCRDQDPRAQKDLFGACYPVLMAIATRYHTNEADAWHVVQEAFLKIATNLNRYRPDVPFEAWIRRIMVNVVIDDFRANQRYRKLVNMPGRELNAEPETEAVALNDAEHSLAMQDMYNLIQALPPVTRQVFNLSVIDGYPHAEIATLLGMKEGTSRWHLAEARKLLKQAIEKLYVDETVSYEKASRHR